MAVVFQIIRWLLVITLVFSGSALVLSASGIPFSMPIQGWGASEIAAAAAAAESIVAHLSLARFSLVIGVALLICGLVVSIYRT
jgi:hypothetical protein